MGSSLITIPSWGLRGRYRVGAGRVWRWVEVIWVEGIVRGELAPFVLKFPQPLAFFGFSPHNFLIRAKMHKSKKETKDRRQDPILTHPECGH